MTFQSLPANKIFRGILIALLLFLLLFFGIFFFLMKGEPFEESKKYINSNPQINEKLGSIKNLSLSMTSSSYESSGASGNAQYKIYVDGDKGNGVVYADMEKQAGVWVVIRANLFLSDNSKIALSVHDNK